MALPVQIEDKGSKASVRVTEFGQLVTAPIAYSDPYYVSIAVANTAYEIVAGKTGKRFVVTGLVIASDKNFASSTVAETVTIYEAPADALDTSLKVVFQLDLLRNDRVVATGLNIISSTGRSLVGQAPTSAAVDITFSGYYVPV